jgi:hypothetical protein
MQKFKIMKKLLLIILIILPTFIKAQQYIPFPDSNAVWGEYEAYMGTCFPCKYQYRMLGDTIINSVQYNKIYFQNDSLSNFTNAAYFGGMREQTKKIYFRSYYCNNEILLYDFTKSIGDTLKNLHCGPDFCDTIVPNYGIISNIDSILIDGNYRKEFHITDQLGEAYYNWIEGIGNVFGLFSPMVPGSTCICYWDLVCFQQNDSVKYLNPKYTTCYPVTTGISNYVSIGYSVSVLPNPFSSYTILRTDKILNDANLIIYNSFGQTVKQIKNISGQTFTLQRDNLSSGLYFLQLTQDNKILTTDKIVIIDK